MHSIQDIKGLIKMESVCPKIEKLQKIKTYLYDILDFMKDYFPLVNAHSIDFICEDQWETILSEPMRTELLKQSEKALCELPMLGHSQNQKLKSQIKACTASSLDLHEETGCPTCKTETLTEGQLFENCENLTKFCQQAWKCSLEGLGLAVKIEDLYKIMHHGPIYSAVPLLGQFMNQKKSHEVEKMAELCALLADNYRCQLVVDIGSGKGYLGSHLFLQHGLPILGIDAITTNTVGAIWRRDKLLKQWNGPLKRAKDTKKGKNIPYKERKQQSRENFKIKKHDTYNYCSQQNGKVTVQTFKLGATRTLAPMYIPITMHVNINCNLTEVARCAICEYGQDAFKTEQSSFKCIDNLGSITEIEIAEDISDHSKHQNKTVCKRSVTLECQKDNLFFKTLSGLHDDWDFSENVCKNAGSDHYIKENDICQQTSLESQKNEKSHDTFLQHCNPNFFFNIGKDSNCGLTCESSNSVLICESTLGIKEVETTISYPSVDGNDKEISSKLCMDSQNITVTSPNLEIKAGESCSSCTMQLKETNELHRDQWKLIADLSPMMLTGLHTCGDLGSSMLELFVTNPDVTVLCGVSCCYHLIHEKFAKEDDIKKDNVMEDNADEGSPYNAFPLSSFLQERQTLLGPKAKHLASQSVYRIAQSSELQGLSFFPRALLQIILQDVIGHTTNRVKGLQKLTQQCDDIYQYIQTAFQRLEIPQDKISKGLIDEYLEKYGQMKQKLAAFFQLRVTLAPCIEAIILLDRVCYLLEQENVADVHLVQLFDPVMSPRCFGIVAVKKSPE